MRIPITTACIAALFFMLSQAQAAKSEPAAKAMTSVIQTEPSKDGEEEKFSFSRIREETLADGSRAYVITLKEPVFNGKAPRSIRENSAFNRGVLRGTSRLSLYINGIKSETKQTTVNEYAEKTTKVDGDDGNSKTINEASQKETTTETATSTSAAPVKGVRVMAVESCKDSLKIILALPIGNQKNSR